jgi:hypothetical protein
MARKSVEKTSLTKISEHLRDILRQHAEGKPVLRKMAENIARRAEKGTLTQGS